MKSDIEELRAMPAYLRAFFNRESAEGGLS